MRFWNGPSGLARKLLGHFILSDYPSENRNRKEAGCWFFEWEMKLKLKQEDDYLGNINNAFEMFMGDLFRYLTLLPFFFRFSCCCCCCAERDRLAKAQVPQPKGIALRTSINGLRAERRGEGTCLEMWRQRKRKKVCVPGSLTRPRIISRTKQAIIRRIRWLIE